MDFRKQGTKGDERETMLCLCVHFLCALLNFGEALMKDGITRTINGQLT